MDRVDTKYGVCPSEIIAKVPIQAFFIKFHQDRNYEKSHEQPERLEIATAQGIALGIMKSYICSLKDCNYFCSSLTGCIFI